MALSGPIGKENLDISFRLHSKTQLFDGSSNALTNAKLSIVASASTVGLVFVGSTNAEILAICTKDLELPTAINQNAPVRKVPMPSQVTQLATNCDGSLLAVDVKLNGVPHIQIYSIASFLSPNVQKLREFRVSSDNSSSSQLCWNPVLNSVLAICTEGGSLNLYTFKEQGIEFHTIDPSLKAKCCCWSPKGKQIVAGFMNGKLMQFNMELKPARIIECPPGIFQGGNFDVIAIQWLSTYQFAVAFLSHQEESRPVLHILNAPKAGPPQYIVYNDVCYSTSEVRPRKIYMLYIQAWGMLLIASANCVDVSFLRISRPGDIPEWTQEFPDDKYPAELPLTPEKDESFPVGFEFETACANKLINEETSNPYPIMPMIHMVSTYGVMCSFYILNTTQTYVDICSPPRPIDPRVQSLFTVQNIPTGSATKVSSDESVFKTPVKSDPAPISHSTPSVPKTNVFGSVPFSQTAQNPSFSQPAPFSGFGLPTSTSSMAQPFVTYPLNVTKPTPTVAQPAVTQAPPKSQPLLATPTNQPLITIPPTFHPPPPKADSKSESAANEKLSEAEDEQIYIKMIQDEIKAFELELKFLMDKSKTLKVNIGTKDESADMRRKLEELDELKKEATETIESLRSDVQTSRLGLTEMFSMVYEAKAKCDHSKNEKSIIMGQNQIQDRSIKRTLDKLRKMISQCEMQVHIVVELLNSQWANYQDTLSKNKKNRMHIPSLEGVYQTLTKQQEIIYNLNAKLKLLKSKLGICDDVKKQKNANINATIESLSDSIISMSLIDQVQNERSKLTEKKHKNLLNYLENREVTTVKPQRPKLPGLNSEIIIEKKIKAMKSLKKVQEQPKKVVQPTVTKTSVPAMPKPTVPKTQPSETVFDFSSSTQKSAVFTPVTSNTSSVPPQPVSISFGKKPDEGAKTTLFGSGAPPSFGFNLGTTSASQKPMVTSSSMPTFGSSTGFASSTLVSNVEKKKEEAVPKVTPKPVTEVKPASTISNANVSVTANFSVSLPSKASPPTSKEPAKVEEKKVEEPKPLASTESTTFTFSLPGKKDTNPVQPTSKSTTSDAAKSAFSFGSASNAFSFASAAKPAEAKPASTSSSTSIFSGGASSVSFGFGDSNKSTSSSTASIFAGGNVTKPVEDAKSASPSTTSTSSTTSLFGSSATQQPASDAKTSFSFASFGGSIPSTVSSAVTPATTATASVFAQKSEPTAITTSTISTTNTVSSSSTDSVLQGLSICSPTTNASSTTPPGNIFATPVSSPKSDTTSIFGTSSFGAGFGQPTTTTSSIFSSSSSSTQSIAATSAPTSVTTTQSGSIFAPATSTTQQTASAFGGLDLSNKASSPTASTPQGSVFGTSLVKPDQSVFGQSTTTTTAVSSGTFSNIFAAAAANSAPKTTNVFASSPASNAFASPSSGSIFGQSGQSTQGSVFGQPATTSTGSIFGQSTAPTTTSSGGSIFGQVTTTTASTGSIFSQNSFSSPSTGTAAGGSIFGGTAASPSPFGSSSIFGSGGTQTQQQTSSIFGGSNVFGAQQAPAASPTTNIFGATVPSNTTSPFGGSGGSIFSQTQNQPTFGGAPTFGSSFGGGGGGSIFAQSQSQPVFGGAPTFGSPKSSIFGGTAAVSTSPQSGQTNNMFEQLGQQSGNLFGSLAQATQPPQQSGFSGSAFSSWR